MSDKSKLEILNKLLEFIRMYPQIIKPETDAETFLEELNNVCTKMFESNDNDIFKADQAAKVFYGIPHLIKPETGIESFIESLVRAGTKYLECFKDERRSYIPN